MADGDVGVPRSALLLRTANSLFAVILRGFFLLRNFSQGNFLEFLSICVADADQTGQRSVSVGGELVAVGAFHPVQQVVVFEQP